MNQTRLEEVLLDIKHKLEDKFGEEVETNYQGSIIVKNASKPNAPVIPEEVGALIKDSVGDSEYNFTDWPFVVNQQNGNLVIRYTPTNPQPQTD